MYILVQKGQTSHIISRGQKWSRLEKENLPYEWTHKTKNWMTGEEGGDISICKGILKDSKCWLIYNMLNNVSQ